MKFQTLFISLIAAVCLLSNVSGQQSSELKDEARDYLSQPVTLTTGKRSLGSVLREVMSGYAVPIGFEESELDESHNDFDFETTLVASGSTLVPSNTRAGFRVTVKAEKIFTVRDHWITISTSEKSLSEHLDGIVDQMKNYRWKYVDGVVQIYPVRGRQERFQQLLDLRIAYFKVKAGEPLGIVRNRIAESVETKTYLAGLGLRISPLRPDPEGIWLAFPESVDLTNVTLREVLNRIALVKKGGWALKSNKIMKDRQKYIEISI